MASPNIILIGNAIAREFPLVRGNVGVTVCRKIKNTSPPKWSQHAYGNATDYYGPPAELERLYSWLTARRGILPLGTICYNNKGGCTTAHTSHLHVDGQHMKGTPACAGGTPTGGGSGGIRKPTVDGGGIGLGEVATAAGLLNPVTSAPTLAAILAGDNFPNPIGSITDFLGLLVNPETYLRGILGVGGIALVLMGLAALLADQGIDLAAKLPGTVGTVAKVGTAVGG